MLQFSVVGFTQQLLKHAGAGGALDEQASLMALFRDEELWSTGAAEDLLALLMRLSPAQLQQLRALADGGSDLPAAASTILDELLGAQSQAFAGLLREQLSPLLAAESADSGSRGLPSSSIGAEVARLALTASIADPDQPMQMPPGMVAALHNGLQVSPAATPAMQLAAKLLDMTVPQPVGGRPWESAIADRIAWMVQGEQQFARLKLNPPQLGPLEIRILVNQEQTSVAFLAHSAAVREALEAALPRLREMFEQQSLQLVQADVADPGKGQGERGPEADHGHAAGSSAAAAHDLSTGPPMDGAALHHAERLVDLFV